MKRALAAAGGALLASSLATAQSGGASTGSPAVANAISTTVANIQHREERPAFDGDPRYFSGKVRVEMLVAAHEPARASGASVTFQPGARTAWHTHPLGQTLIVTAGIGRVQFLDGPIREIRPGDTIWIPPGVKHWHGAAPHSSMTHIALAEQVDGSSVDWLEPVSDEAYGAGAATTTPLDTEPSAAQRLMGDVAPGLAQLTDDVLFGDVWRRPGLAPRDRSLATISALIAMNRPDQLRAHLAIARRNGLTDQEIAEAITHLAFYAGWPSAVTAVGVAREVFKQP